RSPHHTASTTTADTQAEACGEPKITSVASAATTPARTACALWAGQRTPNTSTVARARRAGRYALVPIIVVISEHTPLAGHVLHGRGHEYSARRRKSFGRPKTSVTDCRSAETARSEQRLEIAH